MRSHKESVYKEVIERLKEPGYLDKFKHHFYDTPRHSTIPEMLQKRLGLADGRKWTYKEIGQTLGGLRVHPRSGKLVGSPLSQERVRQCLIYGYRIIMKFEDASKS